jgi:hypothetical protein
MEKKKFLELAALRIGAEFPLLCPVSGLSGAGRRVLGRQLNCGPFVWFAVSARPDNHRVHHAVGWSPSKSSFVEHCNSRVTKHYPRDGILARLQRLDRPRDFDVEHMSVSVGLLVRSIDGFDLIEQLQESVLEEMIAQFRNYAVPYLQMMLNVRHQLQLEPNEIVG